MVVTWPALPPALPGTAVRILATTDVGFAWIGTRASWGLSGTTAGVVRMLERERDQQPTLWLDAGDLAVGPAAELLGGPPWAEVAALPLDAAAAGNHEFDEGVDALLSAARILPFPLLCANADVGLPGHALLETAAGPLGVIGLTHPSIHLFADAPAPIPVRGWEERIEGLAGSLRSAGARWVVALLHEGVTWWPDAGVKTRAGQLTRLAASWARHVDVLLTGHTLNGWTGMIGVTPAGQPHAFAATVLVADLSDAPGPPVIRDLFKVPAVRPSRPGPAARAMEEADRRVVGHSRHTWLCRTGAEHYLPDLIAAAVWEASDADAAFVPPGKHAMHAPLDGCVASLAAGPVSELDLVRLFGGSDVPVVVDLEPGEFDRLVATHDAVADPRSIAGDALWWNWCRMPGGIHRSVDDPRTVAVLPSALPRVRDWLAREVVTAASPDVGAGDACLRVLSQGH